MEVFYFNSSHYSDPINTISLSVFLSFLARTNPFLGWHLTFIWNKGGHNMVEHDYLMEINKAHVCPILTQFVQL